MTYCDVDQAIARLARRQHGVFSRAQVFRAGGTRHVIEARLRSKAWTTIDSGVYALLSHPPTWQQRLMAATLGERFAVVSGKAAAKLHGFEGFGQGRPEITVPTHSHHSSRIAIVHRSKFIQPVRIDGIPVNSAALTFFDIVGQVKADRAESALESGLRTGVLNFDRLVSQYVRLARSRRPGIGVARRLLEVRGDGYVPTASELEILLYGAFDIPLFAPFSRQPRFPWRPSSAERLDGLIELGRVIVEGDGRSRHEQLSAMENDRRRDREAIAHGYLPCAGLGTN